ncbi:MAG TPA: hypothetical protein VGX49_08395 [Jatrophihabitans sp.]|nr:hypothetical protein [Jatrophihabitans sp.]
MLEHEDEIPDGSALTVPPIRRRLTATPLRQVAAWSFTLLIFGVIIATFSLRAGTNPRAAPGTRPAANTTLSCPPAVHHAAAPWVPELPRGLNGAARLAPSTPPVRALVCAYIAPHSPAGSSGSVLLAGDLAGLARELFWAPPPPPTLGGCNLNLEPTDGDYYLLGLSYPAGTEWIAAPGDHCQGVSNGVFSTPHNMSELVSTWYHAGHWTAPPTPSSACASTGTGRYGQQTSLVPEGATAVSICQPTATDGGSSQRTIHSGFSTLIAALNQLPTHTTTNSCQEQANPGTGDIYNLLFSYPTGPPVLVNVFENCLPAIHNGNLQADNATDVLPLVLDLLRSR